MINQSLIALNRSSLSDGRAEVATHRTDRWMLASNSNKNNLNKLIKNIFLLDESNIH